MLVVPPVGLMRPKGLAAARLSTGKSVSLFETDATSQVLGIADANSTGLGLTTVATFETWVKTTKSASTIYLLWKGDALGTKQYSVYLSTGSASSWSFGLQQQGGGSSSNNTTYGLAAAGWTHIAVTREGTVTKFYINGSLHSTDTHVAAAFPATTNPLVLGRFYALNSSGSSFKGLMADTRIWSVARTPTEIIENYNQTLLGTENGLQAYWRFADNFEDSTTNGNHLTLQNAPLATINADKPFL